MTSPRPLPLIRPDETLLETVAVIDRHADGVALVVDDELHLLATITDGDIRRAMLAGMELSRPVRDLLARREGEARPVTAPVDASEAELIALMQGSRIRQIPLLDQNDRVAGLALLDDLVASAEPLLGAVVMAGGFGRRLAPLTDETPKPMLQVGDRPILQHIVEQLRDAGIGHVRLTTHYRGDQIAEHFGSGEAFGVRIDYVSEEEPLGTAGALGLVEADGPLLVMNGDLLTQLDVRSMFRFHLEHAATMTVALRPYAMRIPYGVVELEGESIRAVREKPTLRGFVNAGIYLVEAAAVRYIAAGERVDMPELIERLVAAGHRVIGFPLREDWRDIGTHEDYAQARLGYPAPEPGVEAT